MADPHRRQRSVWFAMPAYTGTIHAETMRSLLTDLLLLNQRGDRVHIHDECGNAMIADCRALILAEFLGSDADTLCFIDSDVSWEAGALVDLIDKPVQLRCGIYPQRKDPIRYCVRWDQTKPELRADLDNGLLAIDGAPAGFLVISRECGQRMFDHYTELHCWNGRAPQGKYCALFDPYWMHDVPVPGGGRGTIKLGEDYSFCQRWRDLGGQLWVNPDIRMGHTGNKTFIGSLGDWLRSRAEDQPKETS